MIRPSETVVPDRLPLILAPTPMHRLERASRRLGIDLWIKRDDLSGFAFGGNKGRKLEFLISDALAQGAGAVVTCGSLQSNFIRQLGAAASQAGLKCSVAAMELPFDAQFGPPNAEPMSATGGNVALDRLLDVDVRIVPNAPWEELYAAAESLADELEASGERVYRIPIGGSTPLGAYSFTLAGTEVVDTGEEFDFIVFASSSGSTQAGLGHHFHGTRTKVVGIACDPEGGLDEVCADLAAGVDRLTGSNRRMSARDFDVRTGYVGPGYGVPSDGGMSALKRLAREQGIFLDPIYSAKAMHGLESEVAAGAIGGKVLFWHTGGGPALFAVPN